MAGWGSTYILLIPEGLTSPVAVAKHLPFIRIHPGPWDHREIVGGLVAVTIAVIWVNFQPMLCAVKGQTLYSVGAQVGQGGLFKEHCRLPSSLPGMQLLLLTMG